MKTAKAPRIRSECMNGGILHKRPCPYIRCTWHLLWCVSRRVFPLHRLTNDEIVDVIFKMKETCCLDFIDSNKTKLREVAEVLYTTRERVRQIVDYKRYESDTDSTTFTGAMTKLRHYTRKRLLAPFIDEAEGYFK